MAASLDEIQAYDLLQSDLEEQLNVFLHGKDTADKFNIAYTVNALIEYACFNCYLEKSEQMNQEFVIAFREWFRVFSGDELNEELLNGFLKFIKH